jgi:hypothetical protein
VHVQRRFPLPELGKKGDGRFEVLRARTRVVLKVFEIRDTCVLGDGLGIFLVFGELRI